MNYVFHLLKKKWTFKKNKKVDLLVLDDLFIEFDFKNLNYIIYNENEINLRYFFAIIFEFFFSKRKNFSFLKELYFKKVISSYNPKIVLGKDRYGFITKYKKHFPQKTSIFYEWGYTFDDQILMAQHVIQGYPRNVAWNINLGKKNETTKNFKPISSPDYYFVLDERSQK